MNSFKVSRKVNLYVKQKEWCSKLEDGTCRPKGMFMKEERITATNRIFAEQKKFPIPGPNKYDKVEAWKK